MLKMTRKVFVVGALAVAACTAGPRALVWAQEKMGGEPMKMGGDHMMDTKMSDEQMKMVIDHIDKMKSMAGDEAESKKLTMSMARVMVMDRMAMSLSMDPKFKDSLQQCAADPAMKKVTDNAMKMAMDQEQMTKIQTEIASDPKAMHMVIHMAAMSAMKQDHVMHEDHIMGDKMKDEMKPAEMK